MKNKTYLLFLGVLTTISSYSQCPSVYNCEEGDWTASGPVGTPGVINTSTYADGTGRVCKVVIGPDDNNLLYLATPTGSLWLRNETTNISTLIESSDFLRRAGISTIAVNPDDDQIILLGTGDYLGPHEWYDNRFSSSGIYRSDDGGDTWEPTSFNWCDDSQFATDKSNFTRISKIIFNPTDGNKAYAIVRKFHYDPGMDQSTLGEIYESLDGGQTWEPIEDDNNILQDKYFWDIEWKPGSSNTFYVSSRSVYKYVGGTWSDVTGQLTGLSIDDTKKESKIVLAVVQNGAPSGYNDYLGVMSFDETSGADLYLSTNGLTSTVSKFTGTEIDAEPELSKYRTAFAIAYDPLTTGNILYYVAGNIFCYSSDGSSFTNAGYGGVTHPDIMDIAVPAYTGSNGRAVYAGTDGGLFRSTDRGNSFTELNQGLDNSQFFDLSYSETDRRILAGKQDCGIYLFDNNDWARVNGGGDGSVSLIHSENESILYYEDYQGSAPIYYSTNSGYTNTTIASYGPERYRAFPPHAPFTTNPDDPDILYAGYQILKKSVSGGAFTDLEPHPKDISSAYNVITHIEVAPSSSNIIYIAASGNWRDSDGDISADPNTNYGDPNGYKIYELFVHTNYGNTGSSWEDISPKIVGVYGEITSIAVSDKDPYIIWITYNGFSSNSYANQNVFKGVKSGGVWTWTADHAGLPEGSTNKIVYLKGSNNKLFVAVDAGISSTGAELQGGVYYKEEGMSSWECFNKGLPSSMVLDIEIGYCNGKIGIATFGRGIWEAELADDPTISASTINIGTNTTWNTDKNIIYDVVVESGNTLIIDGGAVINMGAGRKITVERGARLEVSGATITNLCDAFWKGIEVWGYDDLAHPTHTDVVSGAYPASEDDHGVVFINGNSLIENSHNGISTSKYNDVGWSDPDYHGGIIVALGSTFRNNRRSAEFMSYGYENVSEFISCTFVTDGLLNEKAIPYAHVSLWDVTGVLFQNNVFENTTSFATAKGYKRGIGIYSEEATYDVIAGCITPIIPCGCEEWSGNTFEGLYRGIEARSVGVDFIYPLTIDRNTFIDNERAVLISSIGNIEMINNDIQVPDFVKVICYGLYLEGSINYHIENNFFTTAGSITDDTDPNSGMFVANNNSEGTTIYRNHFEDMEIGVRCQNTNSGLQIRCNDFNTDMTKYNIVVSSGSIPHQGSCIIQPGKNIFTHDCGISHADFRLVSGVPGFNYHYETGEDPTCYSSGINLVECQDDYECLSRIIDPCDEEEEEESQMMMIQSEEEIEELLTTEYAKIDGGNTEDLLGDIAEGNVTKEQFDLIGPYLSDAVLVALIETTTELATSELLDILENNSPLAESVSESLDAAGITNEFVIAEMTESSIMTEEGPVTIYSPMQELMAEIEYLENERAIVIQNVVNAYLKNDNLESAIALLSTENNDWASQKLTALYYSTKDFEAATTSMANITSTDPNINDFKELMTILINVKSEGRKYSNLSPEEESALRGLNSKESSVGIAAGNILRFAYSEDYPEVIDTIIDEIEFKTESISIQTNNSKFKLYPNPASEMVYIELINILSECKVVVNIYDVTGRVASTHLLDSEKSTSWIELSSLESGIYLFEVTCNDISIGTERLIIE